MVASESVPDLNLQRIRPRNMSTYIRSFKKSLQSTFQCQHSATCTDRLRMLFAVVPMTVITLAGLALVMLISAGMDGNSANDSVFLHGHRLLNMADKQLHSYVVASVNIMIMPTAGMLICDSQLVGETTSKALTRAMVAWTMTLAIAMVIMMFIPSFLWMAGLCVLFLLTGFHLRIVLFGLTRCCCNSTVSPKLNEANQRLLPDDDSYVANGRPGRRAQRHRNGRDYQQQEDSDLFADIDEEVGEATGDEREEEEEETTQLALPKALSGGGDLGVD